MKVNFVLYITLLLLTFQVGTTGGARMFAPPNLDRPYELTTLIRQHGFPGITPSPDVIQNLYTAKNEYPKVADWHAPMMAPVNGTRDILVIMIDFSDRTGVLTPAYYADLIFGSTQGAMRHYYSEVSYGLLNITGAIIGSGWYRSAYEMVWWGEDSATGIDDENALIFELAREAVTLADADVDFSEYDANGNHIMDPGELSICIVHAGSGQESTGVSTDIWSHRWYIFGEGYSVNGSPLQDTIVDGVRISRHPDDYVGGYFMQAEDSPMGVFAHEFGHDLGLPDLYDTDYSSDGIGRWGLMATGTWLGTPSGTTPSHLSAWCKIQLGWVTPTLVTSFVENASIPQIETTPTVYKLEFSEMEYFLIENREQVGYDSYLPGSGILIWHIDESVPDNDNEAHKMVDLEEAHGGAQDLDTYGGNRGDANDPYYSNVLGFRDTTDPNSRAYDYSSTGLWVTNISGAGALMTANFLYRQIDVPTDYSTIQKAINSANEGDIIFVQNGTYYESVVVNKTVNLIGENKHATIIDAGGIDPFIAIDVAANNVNISNFTLQNSLVGIQVGDYSNTTLSNNIIADHSNGILVLNSSGNTITGNIIKNNSNTALRFDSAFDNIVHRNAIQNNNIGVGAGNLSYSNILLENSILNNNYGFYINIHSSRFYHNNIIDNNIQAAFYGLNYNNTWDNGYPSGGNFWSDYGGVDADGDGIGDAPYIIDMENQDNYPLMNPWSPPLPDISLTSISTSKIIVGQSSSLYINVNVTNQGDTMETFSVTTYGNSTILDQREANVSVGNSIILTFTWNTANFTKGNYTISAYAWPLPEENDTADNTVVEGWVFLTTLGDINGDRVVDITDVSMTIFMYGETYKSQYWSGPTWHSNMDVNNDGVVDITDIWITIDQYGNSW
ncbi:MAG: M6 family metalloprotease domain-containing protein [Candidatus Bathyarchaeota archaeon]|nr:MAG: M6 family metalloprotease domain-containing protein [Candidatus Bathyarchaeota archaeon]